MIEQPGILRRSCGLHQNVLFSLGQYGGNRSADQKQQFASYVEHAEHGFDRPVSGRQARGGAPPSMPEPPRFEVLQARDLPDRLRVPAHPVKR